MKRVAASWIVARATYPETTYIPPGASVDGLLNGDVITECIVRKGAVRRHPDTFEPLGTRVRDVPALIPTTDLDTLPQPVH